MQPGHTDAESFTRILAVAEDSGARTTEGKVSKVPLKRCGSAHKKSSTTVDTARE